MIRPLHYLKNLLSPNTELQVLLISIKVVREAIIAKEDPDRVRCLMEFSEFLIQRTAQENDIKMPSMEEVRKVL